MWWSGSLDSEHRAIVKSLDALAASHITSEQCADWDERGAYPHEAMDALAAGSWARLPVPESYGGAGASALDLAVVHEALARHSLAVAQSYYSLWVLGAEAINRLGTEQQRAHWLPLLADGRARIAFALTEPGSGSDASAMRTRATVTNGGFSVTGQKVFITGAKVADRIITAVRTKTGERPQDGITLLMIDPNSSGVTIRPLRKVGLRALDLCEVFFDDVPASEADIVGPRHDAWRALRAGLSKERLFLAAISAGALFDLVGRTLEHARTRTTFGKTIGSHQLVAEKIVRMRLAADAAAAMVKEAAVAVDLGDRDAAATASAAKMYASEAYVSAAREAVQIFGGYGFTEDYPVARHYRDCKYLEIGGGTSEIQTIVIARSMGLLA
ncbi:acyl-CoA dehydrogenase family protein [Amycolatopsis acididurans]|nr:acyl-CoA dehydrogenase family protein [Amycolatopsis acididurans]